MGVFCADTGSEARETVKNPAGHRNLLGRLESAPKHCHKPARKYEVTVLGGLILRSDVLWRCFCRQTPRCISYSAIPAGTAEPPVWINAGRLTHRYWIFRICTIPVGFVAAFGGAERPEKQQLLPPVLCKSGKSHIGG